MCYTSVLHFTHCDTRRPAVLNPETGLTLFHPLEPPQPCKHAHPLVPGCPYHGFCCTPRQKFHCSKIRNPQMACMGGQVYHQVVDPRSLDSYDKLLPITADDWEDMVKPTQGLEYEEDIRREFFNTGARMHELATTALKTIKYFYQNASFPNVAQMEEHDFLFHGEVYWKWMVAREELFQLTEAWESRASAGTMEVCPASLLEEHPILSNFPRAPQTHPGFPQFASLPFTTTQTFSGLENVLRWHPFYTTMHNKPSAPSTVAQRSRSPARPQDSKTDIIRHVENTNQPWPGEWEGIIPMERKDLPLRDWVPVSATSSMIPIPGSDLDALSPGPQIPPWVIPYGEEPDMGFKKVIPWDQPATFIESPPVSPRSIPYPRVIPATPDVTEAVAILEINSIPYDDEGRTEPAYPDDGGWSEYIAVEGQAARDFLCVSIPETPSDHDSELKRDDDDERNEWRSDYIGAEERAVWEFLRECDQQSPKLKRRRSDDSDKENSPREAKRHCAA